MLLSFLNAHAQFGVVNAQTLNNIKGRKALFVIEGEIAHDVVLRDVVKAQWQLTEFDFIAPDELKNYKEDTQHFFISYQRFKYDDSFSNRSIKRDITSDGLRVFYFNNSKPIGVINVKFSPASYGFPDLSDKAVKKINDSLDRFLNMEAKYIEALNMIQNHINYFSSEGLKKYMKPKELLSYLSSKKKEVIK